VVNRANVRMEVFPCRENPPPSAHLVAVLGGWGGVRRGCCIVAAYRRNAGVEVDGRGAEA
jgi:hypothetical protein